MPRQRGFSIVELLVVIAMVGVLAAIGSGVTRGLLDRGRLNEAVNTLRYQLQEGRRLAKRLDTDVTVSVTEVGGVWRIVVNGRAQELGQGVVVTPPVGGVGLTLDAPFGTYAGDDLTIGMAVGGATTSLTVTGILTRVVRQ